MKLPLFPRTQITHPPEYKGKPKLYPIVYLPQPLMKASFKQLKQMFPNTNEHDHVLKWAADNIKHNDLQALYLRHYKQNPQVHTEENKNKLGHINGMMGISSEMKNVKIDKNDTLESAFKKYDDAEHTWRQGNGARYIEPEGKPVVDFGDGWAWFDLGRSKCGKEGAAMGHCGNSGDPHPDDRILSLRKIVKVGNKTFHEPALTFINNHGWLGEMKGRANSKPAESYHKRIVELLKHPDIKGMVGAGYMPENNFHFDDLSPEHKNQVRMSNPNLVDLRSDDWDEKQKIFASDSVPKIEKYQHTVKDIFKGKRLKEDLDSGKINIDDLDAQDLRLLTNHRLFQKEHLFKLIDNAENIYDPRTYAQALMAAKNSKHLDDDAISHWIDYRTESAAQVLGNKLNANHIQNIAEIDPQAAAAYLKDHHLFNANHIQTIAGKDSYAAIEYLKDHPLFNANHIQTIAENTSSIAAEYLRNHKDLNANHIQTIIEKDPKSAEQHLHNHPEYEIAKFRAKYDNVQKSLQKTQQLKKVLVSSEPSEGVLKIAKYDGMRPNETHVSTTRVPHERFGSVYVHHFESDDGTNARHLVSMHHDPHQVGVSVLLAARQNKNKPMTVYAAATHPNFQGNRLNYVALREAVKSHGTLHSDVMQSMPAFKNWNRLKQEAGFKVNITKPYREPSAEDASMMPHIAQYSKQAERMQDMEKAVSPEQQKENIKKQRQLKNKEIIAKLKSKVVDKAPAQEPSVQPRLIMSEDDSPVGIPIYLKTHPSHDNLAGVHVHVDKLPSLENYGILDEPRIDRALDSAESRGHSAVYVSTNEPHEPKKPKLQLVKSKLAKAYDIDTAVVADPYLTAKYRKNELNSNHIDYYVKKHPAISAEHLADKLTLEHINHIVKNSPIDAASFLGNKLTPRNVSDIVIASPAAAAAHLQDKLNYGHINYIVKTEPYAAVKNLAYHPLFNQNHIDTIVQHDPSIAAFYFKDHPLLNTKHIDTIAQNSPKAAAAYFAHNLYYLKKYGDSKKINFSSNTENLRKLRDIAEANGGSIHSKQLTQHGLNENALNIKHLKDAKGNYSAQAIQNHIDSLPKHSYAFSKTTWDGDQRHTDKTQNVFQLNITPEIIEKLQQEGVFDTFKQAHNILYSGSHPAHGGTLGWVRYNKSGKQYHIDEIQTDLGHNNLSKLRQTVDFLHENQRIDDDKKNELLQLFTPDKLKKMHNILFSNQVPSKLIHEAFLQHMRNKGKVGSSVHIWQAEPKAKLANQDVSKELPVHMKVGYDEVPPKMDYTEAKYGDAAPQKNNQFRGEPTWKTTLRKSIANRLNKALLSKPPQIVNGQYAKPFSMGGTKKEKKTIYSHFNHPEHAKFNAQEHLDAYWRHQDKIKQNLNMLLSLVKFHNEQSQKHWNKSRDLVDKGDTSRRIEENKPG